MMAESMVVMTDGKISHRQYCFPEQDRMTIRVVQIQFIPLTKALEPREIIYHYLD